MPELNDDELNALFSAVSRPEPPQDMSQRILSAIYTPPTATGLTGFLTSLFGSGRIAAPAGGAFASLLFGIMVGYGALPNAVEATANSDAYLAAVSDNNWDTNFEELLQ